jgi:hypothetical protein
MPIPQIVVERANAKRPVFTVTAGRSGTKYLQKLFALLPDTTSLHEPSPNFVHAMRHGQTNPDATVAFVRDHKLPFIAAQTAARYVETSHLFCKGFAESFIRLGVVPDIIVLRRPPREIARSLLRLNSVPARTGLGLRYLLQPNDPGVLPLPGWTQMSNYQLCFWYALEVERRQLRYARIFGELGRRVVEVRLADLLTFDGFRQAAGQLGFLVTAIKDLEPRFEVLAKVRHNTVGEGPVPGADSDLDAAENAVWDGVFHYEPLLRSVVMSRYAGAPAAPIPVADDE